jgi:hypothetical protein
MFQRSAIFILLWAAAAFAAFAQGNRVLITTLNCYAFFGSNETTMQLGQPHTAADYWRKAGNLVGLWPTNAPLFVGLEEVGGQREVNALSYSAAVRYKHSFHPIFAGTKDTHTEEAVGAVMDFTQGWWILSKPGRDPDLDATLSKHLVVQLTNSVLHTSLFPLVQKNNPLCDPFSFLKERPRTHADGKAYDRILLSDAIVKGDAGLKFENISVQEHSHGKGAEKYWFTDHFPVTATLSLHAKN